MGDAVLGDFVGFCVGFFVGAVEDGEEVGSSVCVGFAVVGALDGFGVGEEDEGGVVGLQDGS